MSNVPVLSFLAGYPEPLAARVAQRIADGSLGAALRQRHGAAHVIRSDTALYAFASELKQARLRHAGVLARVQYDARLQTLRHALGTHTTISRVQGGQAQGQARDPRGRRLSRGAGSLPAHDRGA
ncbi:MAG: hypothetical protein REI09_06000 [Candidatus Dactylopiibacterium sp.]|nr:hypothetical protein [Candidatus Dactylopiibacterium sp.]